MKKFFLLVDDDEDDADIFIEALQDVDPPVDYHRAHDGPGMFDYLAKAQDVPSLIFLDINMPMLSGWECLSKLKSDEKLRDIPVLMYTTSSHPDDKEIAREYGAIGLLTKPSRFGELVDILDRIAKVKTDELQDFLRVNRRG